MRIIIVSFFAVLSIVYYEFVHTKRSITVSVLRYDKNGRVVFDDLRINSKNTVFYVDSWKSHWCPYYNDREFFFAPRINEMLHIARSRGFTVLHLNWKGLKNSTYEMIREKSRKIEEKGMTKEIQNNYPWSGELHQDYIPGFKDKCIYSEYQRYGKMRDQRPNPSVSISSGDLVAKSFKSMAAIISGRGFRNVIFFGFHSNLCLLSATLYLRYANITVVHVEDLVDAAYFYPTQKRGIPSHSKMNIVCNKYFSEKYGVTIKSYDLARELLKQKPITIPPKWLFWDDLFRRYYA